MYEERLNLYTGCCRMQNLLSLCLKEQTAYGCLIREAAPEWLVLQPSCNCHLLELYHFTYFSITLQRPIILHIMKIQKVPKNSIFQKLSIYTRTTISNGFCHYNEVLIMNHTCSTTVSLYHVNMLEQAAKCLHTILPDTELG